MAWDETSATCTDVPAAASLDVLTATLGSTGQPQAKVSYARVATAPVDWAFPAAPVNASLPFAVTLAARFAAQQQGATDVVRSLPPLRPLPKDIFYPFSV